MNFVEIAKKLGDKLSREVPKVWDGRESVLKMKAAGSRHWRQMEWIGFYFQFLCEKSLEGLLSMPGPKYGNSEFDGLLAIPWDFKAHASNTSSHQIIVNDWEAIETGIVEFGAVGVILAVGEVEYNDEQRTFQQWHNDLKGGKSKYERERIKRGAWSRLRKTCFTLRQISFLRLSEDTLVKCGSFQTGFRNADGSPRRSKVLIDLEQLQEQTIHFVEF